MKVRYSALIWLIATLFVVYSFCLNTAAAVFSDSIKASLHATDLGVSIATGAFVLGFACMQIPAGYLLDKYNAKYVVGLGIFLLALGNIAISFSDNLILFALSNLLQGIGASFGFIAGAILISQWFSAKSFPILFGLTQTLACFLAGYFHYYFTVLLVTHSWMQIYQGLAIFGTVLLIISLIVIKSPANLSRGSHLSLSKSLARVLANHQIVLCTFAAATSFGTLLAYASFWYAEIQSYYRVNDLDAVMVSGMVFVGMGVGTPLLGWISNLVHSRKMVVHLTLALGNMALLLVIYLPDYHIDTLIPIKIVSFLTGFFLSGSMLFYTMVSEIATDEIRGVAISVVNTAVFLFNTLLLFLPYLFLTSFSQQFFTYLWVLPFSMMISMLLIYFVEDTYPEQ